MFASIGDNLSSDIGVSKIFTLPILTALSVILFLFVKKNQLLEKYGLCKSKVSASKMLFYIPLMLLMTSNLWYGVVIDFSILETILHILSMFCVGFLEEMIFRGFLFRVMEEENEKSAIIVSSVTFGMGHILNLVNGSGAELLPTILQVIYAIAVGFLFVMIFCKTKSLISCIITHGMVNAISIFANETMITARREIISCILITMIAGIYAIYITVMMKEEPIEDN